MTGIDSEGVGGRIASARRLANLTQDQLASRAAYSASMVRAVEQGREAASPGFIAAVAKALGVEPERLTGTPYVETIEEDGQLVGVGDLRILLTEGHHVRPVDPGPSERLVADVAVLGDVYRTDGGRSELAKLPGLIRRIYGALAEARDDETRSVMFGLLARAYVTAERLCRRFGYLSMTIPALDRIDYAAEKSSDPYLCVQARVKRARALMYHDATDTSLILIEEALNVLDGVGADPLAPLMRGYAHLCGSIAAARGRDLDTARDHIGAARQLVPASAGSPDPYGTQFDHLNTEIHSCAVELEAGDPGKAARQGSALTLPRDFSPPRAGHHWQDTARAWLMTGDQAKALAALNVARRVAPQQTKLHPSVRETLYGIASAERRRTESLGNFARWVGIPL